MRETQVASYEEIFCAFVYLPTKLNYIFHVLSYKVIFRVVGYSLTLSIIIVITIIVLAYSTHPNKITLY